MIRPIARSWLVVDIVGSVFGLMVTLPLSYVFGVDALSLWLPQGLGSNGMLVIVGILLWGAAAISRLAPALALIIAWVGAVLQMLCGFAPLPVDLAIFAVLFATSAWGSRRLMSLGGASAAVGGLVAGVYIAVIQFGPHALNPSELARTGMNALLTSTSVGFALIIAWGAGLLWRQVQHGRQTRLAQLQAEAVAVEEQERVRIARDMHDVVAHSLAVVIAQSDGARYAAASDPALAQEALATIAQTARSALSDVRMLLTQLRHRQGDGPQPTLADLETLFAHVRQAGVVPRVTVDPVPPGEPPAAIQLAVYRILQEALTNAIRHGQGDVDVRLAWHPNRVDLEVRNRVEGEGRGRATQAPSAPGGHGLVGMRERAQLVGGTFAAQHEAGAFVVRVTLPIGPSLH